ncbi:hypothetical protein chiPu_0032212, partial [Chiloscyllium punctatum]|nr:hypothetical protein [Chiloscyllium punctatum]
RGAAGGDHASGREPGPDRRAGAELRAAGHQPVGDAGPEDAKSEQRQCGEHDRHGLIDSRIGAAETGGELGEQCRADTDDDGEHQDLDARRDDVAEHPLGHEGALSEQAEGDEHEAGESRQLEFDQGNEELDGEDEEGEQHQRPSEEHAGDLDEVLEERPVAHQAGDRIEQRSAGIEPGLRDLAGAQQIGGRETGAGGLQ